MNSVLEMLLYRSSYDAHRDLIRHNLTVLGELHELESPKFVFAHVVSPHPPFLFNADGSSRESTVSRFTMNDGDHLVGNQMKLEDYLEGYREQIQYVNARLREVVISLRKHDPDAIIILQGDHGPGSMLDWKSAKRSNLTERLGILNAYYLPDGGAEFLYDTITPINTFRLILTHYFGMKVKLLADKSYYSSWNRPYDMVRLPEQ